MAGGFFEIFQLFAIATFDDETEKYKKYPNKWLMEGEPSPGYWSLGNALYPHIIINRISKLNLKRLTSVDKALI